MGWHWTFEFAIISSFVLGHWAFFLAWLRRTRACPKNGRLMGLNPALLLLLSKT
jgi:hypothetical protein